MESASDIRIRLIAWLRDRAASLLEGDGGQIQVDVRFHDLGLDSVDAIVLIGELEDLIGIQLTQASVYRRDTIALLADHCATLTID